MNGRKQTRAGRAARLRARRRRRRMAIRASLAVLAIAAVAVLIAVLPRSGAQMADAPQPSETPALSVDEPQTTPAPTQPPRMLPILSNAETPQKQVAITVDDLNQAGNLTKILDLCEQYGAKITLFALGDNVNKCSAQLKRAYEMGMEIENHTYDHKFIYKLEDDELIWQMQQTEKLVDQALGVNYHMSFFRPPGGNGRDDPRLHALLIQANYRAVAHWSLSGTAGVKAVVTNVKAGDVILYHTTDADVTRLETVIPMLSQMGYQMVTMNELFGYEANAVSAYDPEARNITPPISQPYTYEGMTFAEGTRMYGVKLLQNRLIELGYLAEGNADGDYGSVTGNAIKMYQTLARLPVTGKADPETRAKIMLADAPYNTYGALSVK